MTDAAQSHLVLSMPRVADSTDVYLVVDVTVRPGDRLQPDTPVANVETDKVDVEVPAGVIGVVDEVLITPDQEIAVGQPLLRYSPGPPRLEG